MTVHDYSLTCPNWAHFYKGSICERCLNGKEYWCVLQNCRKNIFESVGYALRSAVARKLRLFHKNVTIFIALTEYGKSKLIEAKFDENRIAILPNTVEVPNCINPPSGKYVAYAGRITQEKGIEILMSAMQLTKIPLHLAGDVSQMPQVLNDIPENVKWVGVLAPPQLKEFYRQARFLVVPSIWPEPFGLVVLEAMAHGLPVVASRIGGLPYIIEDGINGLLFEPGNAKDLAEKMNFLWGDRRYCLEMGMKAREMVKEKFDREYWRINLLSLYKQAIDGTK